ncbi:MAG TPA: hypothetical protein VHS31_06175, partial [Tepidisphaeraceae bacterium]|nr:hypothetical protein [Tepidisphaeraceae bacterium]
PGDDFSGEVKVATVGSCIIRLDGRTLGQQGGFDPYHPQMRGQLYRVEAINPGKHELSIEMIETPGGAPLRVDLLLTGARGRRVVLRSDADWTVARDDDPPRPVKIHLRQEEAAASWMLFRRPHPLPQTRWLEGDKPSPIMDLRLIPPLEIAEAQTFTWVVPPGAVALHLMLESEAKPILLLDGDPCLVDAAGWATLSGVLPSRARTAELTVQSRQLGGGVFTGPVTYRFDDAGILRSGNWIEQGLRSYSGAIRLSQHFSIGRIDRGSILLDLGEVRGTVEARVNGKPAGVRVLSPYTFDVSELVRAGENELELIVTNTLSNFLSTWSPTTWWSPDQLSFGVYGPTNLQRISLKDRPSS